MEIIHAAVSGTTAEMTELGDLRANRANLDTTAAQWRDQNMCVVSNLGIDKTAFDNLVSTTTIKVVSLRATM